jgi:hypothetical protein
MGETQVQRVTHVYGPGYREGVLIDHLHHVAEYVRTLASGRLVVVDREDRGIAVPVLCGAIVPIRDEDGTHDGRCGEYVESPDACGCPWHDRERRQWARLSEAEKWEIEMRDEVFS